MTKLLTDKQLSKLILNKWLVHDEDCSYSFYGSECDCIQQQVVKNLLPIFKSQKKAFVELAIGEEKKFKWVTQDEYSPPPQEILDQDDFEPMLWLVCSLCGHWQEDPESPHFCETYNSIVREMKQRI